MVGHALRLLRRERVDVLVQRSARMDLVLDPVDARHRHRRERDVRVAGRIGEAHLDPLGLRARRVGRDADRRRAVAARVGEVHRRFVARHQPLVRVGGRVGEGRQRLRVLEDPADVVERELREARVLVPREQRLAVLPDRLVAVHARAVVLEQRLRHERDRLAVAAGDVLDAVLVDHQLVAHLDDRAELHVDLGLAAGRHLVVLGLDLDAALLHLEAHLGADVLQRVHRRDREVALLVARLVAEVRTAGVLLAAGVPAALDRVEEVEAAVRARLEARRIEDEELGLGPEVDGVADARALQVVGRLLGDVARDRASRARA